MLSAHEAALSTVTLSNSDTTHVLSGSADGGLLVWRLDTGRLLHRLAGHTNAVTAVRATDTQNLGVSGLYCNAKYRYDIEKLSAILALCEGNHQSPVDSLTNGK